MQDVRTVVRTVCGMSTALKLIHQPPETVALRVSNRGGCVLIQELSVSRGNEYSFIFACDPTLLVDYLFFLTFYNVELFSIKVLI